MDANDSARLIESVRIDAIVTASDPAPQATPPPRPTTQEPPPRVTKPIRPDQVVTK